MAAIGTPPRKVTMALRKALTDIQHGHVPDRHGGRARLRQLPGGIDNLRLSLLPFHGRRCAEGVDEGAFACLRHAPIRLRPLPP